LGAASSSEPVPTGTGGPGVTTPAGGAFTLTDGVERDVCGIGLRVKFVPPSSTTGQDNQAFLVGGPVGGADPSADQPAPANVAPARTGAIATVVGKRFKVDLVDLPNRRVTLEALC
jgi:hypothetical protein